MRLTLVINLVVNLITHAQDIKGDIMSFKVIPPGVEASALGNYLDVPSNLYTGKANISIPIYTLTMNSLTLPITLNYNSGGVKIEDIPSAVGAGWNLDAGGMISRSIRGLADEDGMGYFLMASDAFYNPDGTINPDNPAFSCSNADGDVLVMQVAKGEIDFQPDNWFFSFPGHSGRIVFKRDKTPVFIPRKNLHMVETPFTTFGATGRFVIKDEMGNTYTFGKAGMTHVKGCSFANPNVSMPTTWVLLSIQSASALEEITFEYEYEHIKYQVVAYGNSRDLIAKNGIINIDAQDECYSKYEVIEPKLHVIRTNKGDVITFERDLQNPRLDLEGGYRLKSIEITSGNCFVKGFELTHSYNGNSSAKESNYLMLKRVREYDEHHNYSSRGYDLEYYEGSLPGRLSKKKDHWGYYNGVTNARSVPAYRDDQWDLTGADREPNFDYAQIGALKRITYPTRGYTEYRYALNTYNNLQFNYKRTRVSYSASVTGKADGVAIDSESFTLSEPTYVTIEMNVPCQNQSIGCNYSIKRNGVNYSFVKGAGNRFLAPAGTYVISVSLGTADGDVAYENVRSSIIISRDLKEPITALSGGGLRVEQIIFHDGHSVAYRKSFDYKDDNGLTRGKIMSWPKYAYTGNKVNASGCVETGSATFLVRSATTNVSLATTQGSYVGYPMVTEYYESVSGERKIGKIVHEFSHHQQVAGDSYPFIYNVNLDYKNGLVLKKTEFAFNGDTYEMARVLENTYDFLGLQKVHGMQAAPSKDSPCVGCMHTSFMYSSSYDQTESVILSSSTETTFNENGTSVKKQIYKYDLNTLLPIATYVYNSDGTLYYTSNKYPNHLQGQMAQALSNKKMSAILIEKQIWLADASVVPVVAVSSGSYIPDLLQYKLVQGIYNSYNQQGLPLAQYILRSSNPISFSSFTSSQGDYIPEDNKYELEHSLTGYDDFGNIHGIINKEGLLTSYKWGYDNRLPICEAVGASHQEVFVENFESSLQATEGPDANTGGRYWNSGTVTLSFTLPNSKDYLMDYWYFKENRWIAVIGVPYSTTIASGGERLDDIRIYPKGTLISSYTYRPGWGMTSVIDANGDKLYYEYDGFGRLSIIRDKDFNIVKHIDYNYKDNDE